MELEREAERKGETRSPADRPCGKLSVRITKGGKPEVAGEDEKGNKFNLLKY